MVRLLSSRLTAMVRFGGPAFVLGLLLWGPVACEESPPPAPLEPLVDERCPLRDVRVLLASDAEGIRLRAEGDISLTDTARAVVRGYPGNEGLTVEQGGEGEFLIAGAVVATTAIGLEPTSGEGLFLSIRRRGKWSPETHYPGSLRLILDGEGGFAVINSVDMERYVSIVVAGEVWPTFHEEAYRAQAIVARTFVLYQMERRPDALYDVKATQSSQVYHGVRTDEPGRRAVEATRFTRGLVCTWRDGDQDRLFSTYYSAACGGMSQSAAIFGAADDVPPLAGGVKCDYCRIAPGDSYRWGPVRLNRRDVMRRLAARYSEVASLGRLTGITVLGRTPGGRPVRLRLTGSTGKTHDLLAEHFRLALGPTEIRSTDCRIRLSGDDVVFTRGRGFGHGLGLCQWGMQGQALQGKSAAQILRFYYPGSKLTRVY